MLVSLWHSLLVTLVDRSGTYAHTKRKEDGVPVSMRVLRRRGTDNMQSQPKQHLSSKGGRKTTRS